MSTYIYGLFLPYYKQTFFVAYGLMPLQCVSGHPLAASESSCGKFNGVQKNSGKCNELSEAPEGQNCVLDPASLELQQVITQTASMCFPSQRKVAFFFLLWSHN